MDKKSMLGNSLKKISLEEEKPEKSTMYCKIDYDIAERIRDYKYHKKVRLDKAMEEIFLLGLKVLDDSQPFPTRPASVVERNKNKGLRISKSKLAGKKKTKKRSV